VALVTAVVIGVMSALSVRAHRDALVAQLARSADQLSETIASSTYYDMLENQRAALHREIVTIGHQKGIDRVRLFNGVGTIMFSSDESEMGHSVDKNTEACFACHAAGRPLQRLPTTARARIYHAPDGHRVLGMIRPIHNEERCWNAACHAHAREDAVLGVLDVNLSMTEADRQIAGDQRRLALLALIAIAASSLMLWWLSRTLILRPVAALIAGTRKVAEGDLHSMIPVTARHELGDVARAFNEMTRRLSEAQRQLTQADKLASVGRLAAGVAHEINNPLTGVLTYASFLERRAGDHPEMREDLAVIVRETKRCREIVRGLLDFARQTPPRRQSTDLNEVARRGVAIVLNQLTLARVSIDLDLAADLRPVPADANQIQQVVVNLLLNAADAIEGGGTIRLHTGGIAVPPRGHAPIRVATCPKGCDLLDSAVRLAGLPMVRVLRRAGEREATVHLDPIYGRLHHRSSDPGETGTVAAYLCPACRARLDVPESRCDDCGAPAFAVAAGNRGRIQWCSRRGCSWTRWEAMDAGGARRFAEIVVEDDGRGIAEEDLSHLFEPFFTTKGNRGSGLGLAITWGIVEGHGGSIEVESTPGRGTRFTVRLPEELGEPAPAAAPAAAAPEASAASPGAAAALPMPEPGRGAA
jgi:two-component system NtrC family sensor kinase